MKVFLDDIRVAPDTDWIIVKTAKEAIKLLQSGDVEIISLDHDLGENVKSGYDVAKWIEKETALNDFNPPKILIHSANPVGQRNIQSCIDSIQRFISQRN